jgi:hypothetical protein
MEPSTQNQINRNQNEHDKPNSFYVAATDPD